MSSSTLLRAGLAQALINPPLGQPMGGFLDRVAAGKGAAAIHDPLHARALVLQAGDLRVALVSIDLLFFCSRHVVEEARRKWKLDHVILNSTHTHAGPIPRTGGMIEWSNLNVCPADVLDFEAFRQDPWYAQTEETVVAVIGEAAGNLFNARIGAAQGTLEPYIAHNRRVVRPDGSVSMMWANPKRVPTAPLDPTVRVVRLDDEHGSPRLVLTHFGCHPVTLGPANLEISADFAGPLVAELESRLGCRAMYLQGAQGDIDPCDTGLSGPAGFQAGREVGLAVAHQAAELAAGITTRAPGPAPLRAIASVLDLPHRREPGRTSPVGLTTLLLDGQAALVGVSGEPFVQLQLALARQSSVPVTCLMGLSYSGLGTPFALYLPTAQAAREGGYGADQGSFLAPDAGERLVDRARTDLAQLASA